MPCPLRAAPDARSGGGERIRLPNESQGCRDYSSPIHRCAVDGPAKQHGQHAVADEGKQQDRLFLLGTWHRTNRRLCLEIHNHPQVPILIHDQSFVMKPVQCAPYVHKGTKATLRDRPAGFGPFAAKARCQRLKRFDKLEHRWIFGRGGYVIFELGHESWSVAFPVWQSSTHVGGGKGQIQQVAIPQISRTELKKIIRGRVPRNDIPSKVLHIGRPRQFVQQLLYPRRY